MRKLFCIAICLLASMSVFAQYGTTKQYEYGYSSKEHKLKIQVDYPTKGNPAFLRRVRTFIMETLEFDPYSGAASIGRYNGNSSDGQAVNPANAYILKPDANELYVLRITDPQLFGSTSEYLVILVE